MALEEQIKVKVDAVLEGLAQFQTLQKAFAEIKKAAAQKIRVEADTRAFQSDLKEIQSDLKSLQKLADKGVKLDADPTALAKQLEDAQERLRSLRNLSDKPLELEIETNTLTSQIKELQDALKKALGDGEAKLALQLSVETDSQELEKSVSDIEGQLKDLDKLAANNKIDLEADAAPVRKSIAEVREALKKLRDVGDDPIKLKAETEKIEAQIKGVQTKLDNLGDKTKQSIDFSRKVKGVTGVLRELSGAADGSLGRIDDLAKASGVEIAALTGPVGLVIAALAALAAAGLVSLKVVSDLAQEFAELATEVDNTNKQTGLSIELVSALRVPLQAANQDLTDLTDLYANIAGLAQNAATGNKEATATLKAFGLTAKDVLSDADKSFGQIIKTLASIEEGEKRIAAAAKIGGEEGGRFLALLAAKEPDLKKFVDRLKETGVVMSKENVAAARNFSRAVTALSLEFDGLKFSIGQAGLPALTVTFRLLNDILRETKQLLSGFGGAIQAFFAPLLFELLKVSNFLSFINRQLANFRGQLLDNRENLPSLAGGGQIPQQTRAKILGLKTDADIDGLFTPAPDANAGKKAADAAKKAQEERERAIERAEELRRAKAAQTLAFLTDSEKRHTSALETQLRKNEISIGEFYRKRQAFRRDNLEAELKEAEAQKGALAAQPQRTPDQQQKVALEGLRIDERIKLLKGALADLPITTARELTEARRAFEDGLTQMGFEAAEVAAQVSDDFTAAAQVARDRIIETYRESLAALQAEIEGTARIREAAEKQGETATAEGLAARQKELEAAKANLLTLIDTKTALAELAARQAQAAAAADTLAAKNAAIDAAVESGAIGQSEAIQQRLDAEKEYKAVLDEIIARLNQINAAQPKPLAPITNTARDLGNQGAGLGTQTVPERFALEQEKFNRVLEERAAKERDVQILVRNGQLSELQGRERLKKIYQEYLKQLEEILQALADIAVEANPEQFAELNAKLTELRQRIADTSAETQSAGDEIKSTLSNALETGFTNFFSDVISGTKSVGDAFKDLARTILQALAQVIIKLIVTKILMAALGGGGGGGITASASGAGAGGVGGSALGSFAEGGPIAGPGTDTSDNLLARVSPGEYVVRAKSVRAIGVDALHQLNRYGRLDAFADGGLVGPEGPTNSPRRGKISIVNNFNLPNVRDVREFKANEAAIKRDLARATAQGAARFQGGR